MANGLASSVSPEFKPIIEKVATIVHQVSGNKYGEKQSFMIESRVKKRMMELAIKDPQEYIKFIEKNKSEVTILVSLMTTHHTFFFREFAHFELLKIMLPNIVEACKKRNERTVNIWSAACSRGHEVYSLAMFMEYFLPNIDPSMTYKILGTDIDGESVAHAANGVYHHNELKEIPMNFLGDHWAKGTGDIALYRKIKRVIRNKCDFRVGNLLDVPGTVKNQKFDIVFCRNVFIYFEPQQIEKISQEILKTLHFNSLFFSGMSESLLGYNLNVTSVGPSVYQNSGKPVVVKESTSTSITIHSAKLLKVLCVDDSPTIHNIMKKILTKEAGFEIVANAMNGIEAAEKLKLHSVDLMTLDIHMPVMDGVTYLKKYFTKNHPPVVMVSSASREDSDVALQALRYGASDYVEKPTLMNLEERGDEIKTKLRALGTFDVKLQKISSIDKDFGIKVVIDKPETKMRLIFSTIADVPKINKFFTEAVGMQPPTVILVEGYGDVLEALTNEQKYKFKQKVELYDSQLKKLIPDTIYFSDARKVMKFLQQDHSTKQTSILCYGIMSRWASQELLAWKNCDIVVEDYGQAENIRHPLYARASDIVPATSFYYLSNKYLGKK